MYATNTWIGRQQENSPISTGHLVDPATGVRYAESRASSVDQVDRAVAVASEAHARGDWRRLGPEGRAERLHAIADRVEQQVDLIGELDARCSGVPIATMSLIASSVADTVRSAAELGIKHPDEVGLSGSRSVKLLRVPWGPTAVLLPWNVPTATLAKKAALALAAGACLIIKPSPIAPWGPQILAEIMIDLLPAGVVSLVHGAGAVGTQLVGDPRVAAIAMTGSTATGRKVARTAGPRFTRLQLELGSSNPAIVMDDADLDSVSARIASGALKLSGQWCEAPERVFVPARLRRALVDRLVEAFEVRRIGAPLDRRTDVGPLATAERRDELARRIALFASWGATVHHTQTVPSHGAFLPPTVVDLPRPYEAEELFGPVVVVRPYDHLDDAIGEANSGQTGLAGYVFGADENVALDVGARLLAGEVKINGTSVLDMASGSAQSFFGASGLGGHGDADVLEFFRGVRVVGVDDPSAPV